MSDPFFNYIITIHNKQDLIQDVLLGTLLCSGPNSRIYAVLDGCTDETEKILDEFTRTFDSVPLTKVYAPDVHELLSINIGLRAARQEGEGYNIILQDDVILADLDLERKVKRLYEWGGDTLGYVSFRLGANLEPDALGNGKAVPLNSYVENAYGHGVPEAEVLLPGRFAYRTVPIKSPVCIPTRLVRRFGMLNEELAPFAHDDTDLAIRLASEGFSNGVFAVRFYSDLKWGGTRVNPHSNIHKMLVRNMGIIRKNNSQALAQVASSAQRSDTVTFPELCTKELDAQAAQQWASTLRLGAEKQPATTASRLRSGLRRLLSEVPSLK